MIFNKVWFEKTKCNLGVQALRNYHKEYDDSRKQFKSMPRHDWSSHAADAFRYFAVSWRERDKAKNVKKYPKLSIA